MTRIALVCALLLPSLYAGAPPRPNVVLITIDTLRADNLSCYGYGWKTSPYIDGLAAEGTRFARAYTAIPLTGPSHISILTSRYPQEHGARRNGVAPVHSLPSLPVILHKNGYRTAGFISAWPLTNRLTHLGRWFGHYDEDLTRTYQLFNSSRWAEDVTPRAIDWLKQNMGKKKPVFLWVHYFDPHSPYIYRSDFKLEPTGTGVFEHYKNDEMKERVRDYDTEIAYTDWYLGKLLATIRDLGQEKSTLVVLMADHGESLGEHGYIGHGRHLYENIVHIPLIFRYPGVIKAGQVINTPVSSLDVTPTILDLVLHKAPKRAHFRGRKLTAALEQGTPPPERPIYFVTFPGKKGFFPEFLAKLWVHDESLPSHFGFVEGEKKVIWSPDDDNLRIYNLVADPDELHAEVVDEDTHPYENQTAQLTAWFQKTKNAVGREMATERDLKILKSLGYTQ